MLPRRLLLLGRAAPAAPAALPVPAATAGTSLAATGRRRGCQRGFSGVVLSEQRLKEFMRAEIGYFAGMSVTPIKLEHIFTACTPELAAELIHRQLPIHFATRIKHIEALPDWASVPEFAQVRHILGESFANLRLLDQSSTALEPLTKVIHDLRSRHKAIVPLLGVAMGTMRYQGTVSEAEANDWLNSFLLARISTEMTTLHYMKLVNGEDASTGRVGIIDTRCDPSEICRQAVANVHRDPRFSSVQMPVVSYTCKASEKGLAFSFLPQYLLMVVEELIKNSAYATVVRAESSASSSKVPARKSVEYPPVCVFVGADDRQVMIEVSDKGGGIPSKDVGQIWSYSLKSDNSGPASSSETAQEFGSFGTSWADPLSGLGLKQRLGMGLPLTKLYVQYLGGSLELMSLPGIGVDTFINLKRIDPAEVGGTM